MLFRDRMAFCQGNTKEFEANIYIHLKSLKFRRKNLGQTGKVIEINLRHYRNILLP